MANEFVRFKSRQAFLALVKKLPAEWQSAFMSLLESVVFRNEIEDYVENGGDLITHADLQGLSSDDHTQYLLADGTRALTDDWDAGSYKITAEQLESDVATGTAPLVVASTTLVSNLNADQLDGYDESDFDYSLISGNDGATDVTGAELEELTDGSDTTLHIHDATYVKRDEWLQNGFPDATEVSLSWDDASRTLTIDESGGGSYRYYHDGILYTETEPITETIAGSDAEGLWVFYIDGEGSMASAKDPSYEDIENVILYECIVAYVYWDETNDDGRLLDELHGSWMSPATHHYLHDLEGSRYSDGMSLGDMSVDENGNTDSHAQFSITAGEFYDEDRGHDTSASGQTATKEVYYVNGDGDTRWVNAEATFPVYAIGGVIAYNNSGTLTAADASKYILYHVFATNLKTDAGADYPCIMVPGQAQYATKTLARDAAYTEILNLTTGSWPMEETVPVATVIYYHGPAMSNGVEAAIVSTDTGDDYIDWRTTTISGTGTSTSDHGLLSGLADDDHTQYLLADGTRGLSGDWDAGAHEIRAETFESDVATGTAPFTIASTTVVTNLNADQLDGNDAADIDYSFVSGNDGATDVTASELEELTDGSSTTLHEHDYDYSDISGNDGDTDVTGAELEELTDGSETALHTHDTDTQSSSQIVMNGMLQGIQDNTATAFTTIDMASGPSNFAAKLFGAGFSTDGSDSATVIIEGWLMCAVDSSDVVALEWVETANDDKGNTGVTFGTNSISAAESGGTVTLSVTLDSSLNESWTFKWIIFQNVNISQGALGPDYYEDFESYTVFTQPSTWATEYGNWTWDVQLAPSQKLYGTAGTGTAWCLWTDIGTFTDCDYAICQAYIGSGGNGRIALRFSGDFDAGTAYCYMVELNDGSNTIAVKKIVNGSWTTLSSTTASISSGYHWIALQVDGTDVKGAYGSTKAACESAIAGGWNVTASDSAVSGPGYLAVGAGSGISGRFDEVSVYNVS